MTTIAPARRAWVEQLMGMPVSVHLRGNAARTDRAEECVAAVFDELRAVDALFSPYLTVSEVSRIGRGELTCEAAHPLVRQVLGLCEAARVRTGGAFDAFRNDASTDGRPRFDPTGLVKGWAAERAATHLARATGCDVSINAGGDIAGARGSEAPDDGPGWRVGIEDPRDRSRILAVVSLGTGGVATSGTAARGPHIVRPRDGRPAADLLAVTVVGPSLMWADVLATAAFVRGRGALDWLATVPGYEGLAVDGAGTATATPGLEVIG